MSTRAKSIKITKAIRYLDTPNLRIVEWSLVAVKKRKLG